MRSLFENPGLSHIGSKILLCLDFLTQAKCRKVCRLWNQIIEELFFKMLPKTSLEHLKVLLDDFSTRNSLKPSENAKWNCFIKKSYKHFENFSTNFFKLYLKHVLNTTRKRNWFRNYSPTHEFVFLGNIKMVKYILRNGLDVYNPEGWTILHEAIEYGQTEIVKYLVDLEYFSKVKALNIAGGKGNLEIIKMLAPDPKRVVLNRDQNGYNPIHNAVIKGHIEIVKYFIQNVKGLKARYVEGNTPLHLALKESEFEIVKLIAENVDNKCIELVDNFGRNVIHTAAINGEVECLKLLCQKTDKIDLKVKSDGNTPLHYAAEYGHLDCVEVLMEFKSIRNLAGVSWNADMLTPLELAQKYNHHEIVNYLNSFLILKSKE